MLGNASDPTSWLALVDRYGVTLVMLSFVCTILVSVLVVVWRHFLVPTRERELKFIDEVAEGLRTERSNVRTSLESIARSVQAIEGYTEKLQETNREIHSATVRTEKLLKEHDDRSRDRKGS